MGIPDRSVATDDGFREYGGLFAIDTTGRFCAEDGPSASSAHRPSLSRKPRALTGP